MGAAGRDFHNFNTVYRGRDDNTRVVAFTAAQIPNIDGRCYPAELAGDAKYPQGIPIEPEAKLEALIRENNVAEVVFAYSDVRHETVMRHASRVLACGADFKLLGGHKTMVPSTKPVIAVVATRTGCGKSQTTRYVARMLQQAGQKVVAIRHPMPYGDLLKQRCQRYATYADLDANECTIEEREEYEPHIDAGVIVYAGVDYEMILREAEKEADFILWDGGNNDTSFYTPDYNIVIADALRPGHELMFHPGEVNLRSADCVLINKIGSGDIRGIEQIRESVRSARGAVPIVEAASPISVSDPSQIEGKRVLVVEDGPSLTHGGMSLGAGVIAARKFGAAVLVDPSSAAVGSIRNTLRDFPHLEFPLLPAMGYGEKQTRELEATINAVDCDVIVSATPIDLSRVIKVNNPIAKVQYELQEVGKPTLEDVIYKKFGLVTSGP